MNLVNRLLRRNISTARILGFLLSNFLGLAIICTGLQVYLDLSGIWQDDGSFISTEYMVVNRKVTGFTMLGESGSGFTETDIAELRSQPWVRNVGRFSTTSYEVRGSLSQEGRGMSTMLFFESIPDSFVDVAHSEWRFDPSRGEVPIIIAKDYLTLYNFGFAQSAGLPKLSEQVMSGLPLALRLESNDGTRRMNLTGRVVGYSNRLNTVLVPQEFMEWSNSQLGDGATALPTRLIVDVSSPGDVAIPEYLESHGLETGGDRSASSASFLLKVVAGVIVSVGIVITVMSLFILLLSMSLLLEKNRATIHQLLLLGYPFRQAEKPYRMVVFGSCLIAAAGAVAAMLGVRAEYIAPVRALGAGEGGVAWSVLLVAITSCILIGVCLISVRRKIMGAWRC